jgi:hypothetical protein
MADDLSIEDKFTFEHNSRKFHINTESSYDDSVLFVVGEVGNPDPIITRVEIIKPGNKMEDGLDICYELRNEVIQSIDKDPNSYQ